MGQKKIQKALITFARRAKEKLNAEKIILFGSFVSGKANEYSDVDVAVLSKSFSKIPMEKRLDVLYPLTTDLFPDFHPFGFTPEEFLKANKTSLVSEIKLKGIIITQI